MQCGGVYFWLYGIVYRMPIQQKLNPPALLFNDFRTDAQKTLPHYYLVRHLQNNYFLIVLNSRLRLTQYILWHA